VLKFCICSLMRDLASCVEYPSLTAKSSTKGISGKSKPLERVRTCLEFESSAQDIHQKLHHGIHGCKSVGEQDKSNDDRKLFIEAKRLIQRAVVDEDGEQGEDIERMELRVNVRGC